MATTGAAKDLNEKHQNGLLYAPGAVSWLPGPGPGEMVDSCNTWSTLDDK